VGLSMPSYLLMRVSRSGQNQRLTFGWCSRRTRRAEWRPRPARLRFRQPEPEPQSELVNTLAKLRGSGPVEAVDHQAVPNILPSFGAFQPSPDSKHREKVIVVRHAEPTSCRVVQRTTILGCEDGAHQLAEFIRA
jgi:hypothetical protein